MPSRLVRAAKGLARDIPLGVKMLWDDRPKAKAARRKKAASEEKDRVLGVKASIASWQTSSAAAGTRAGKKFVHSPYPNANTKMAIKNLVRKKY